MTADGQFITTVEKTVSEVVKDSNGGSKLVTKTEIVIFKSRNIVLASGGK